MSYTAEQLAGMSDYEIEGAVEKLRLMSEYQNATDVHFDDTSCCVYFSTELRVSARSVKNYCSSWSVTGPLMVKYKTTLQHLDPFDCYQARIFDTETRFIDNPLRAICEVILMMGE